jgi:hypothetical protein
LDQMRCETNNTKIYCFNNGNKLVCGGDLYHLCAINLTLYLLGQEWGELSLILNKKVKVKYFISKWLINLTFKVLSNGIISNSYDCSWLGVNNFWTSLL